MDNRKIGILTLPFEPNYGYILQAFALQKVLTEMGCDVEVLNRGWNNSNQKILYRVKRWCFYNIVCKRIYKLYSNIPQSPLIRTSEKLRQYVLENNFNTLVVGSDQVWRIENTRCANLNFFFDFLSDIDTIKKISYAASFGNNTWKGTYSETKIITDLLKKFDGISVREESGVDMCHNIFGVQAESVLDPTMLLSVEAYSNLFKAKKTNGELVTYILDMTVEKDKLIKKICNKKNLRIKELYQKKNYYYESVESWVASIFYADYVIVDSFHGMVFSILFNKQFIVIGNKKRGMDRFISLLRKLNLRNRLIEDVAHFDQSILTTEINYTDVNALLAQERTKSMLLLKKYIL